MWFIWYNVMLRDLSPLKMKHKDCAVSVLSAGIGQCNEHIIKQSET